jgi:hypothetical protein
MAYACYEGKHPDVELLVQTPHFQGILLKAQLKSSSLGSGALDLVKGGIFNLTNDNFKTDTVFRNGSQSSILFLSSN